MKKLLSLFFALLLILSLCGCSAPVSPETVPTTEPVPTEPAKVWYQEGTIEITAERVDAIVSQEFESPKNVILLIGDGMGINDIALSAQYGQNNYDFGLVLDRIPHRGLATTKSASHKVTDSAAAGTALATGVKTTNGVLGMDRTYKELKNISEIAREQGMKPPTVWRPPFPATRRLLR